MKLFVWDFHGTLERGNENAVLEITNEILKFSGHSRRMTETESRFLYGRRWNEYFSFLLPNKSEKHCRELAIACRELARSNQDIIKRNIKLNEHAVEVLQEIAKRHTQIIISNSTPAGIRNYLECVGIQHLFPEGNVFGVVHPHFISAKSKVEALNGFIGSRKFEKVIAIGDSPHDMIGTVNYLYAHSGTQFRECSAHFRINDLREVRKEI